MTVTISVQVDGSDIGYRDRSVSLKQLGYDSLVEWNAASDDDKLKAARRCLEYTSQDMYWRIL